MTRVAVIVLAIGVLAGCGRTDVSASNPARDPLPARTETGVVVFPPDSPMLKQIRVEPVKTDAVRSDEVVSPGKIEANPNRVSHVVLPVAGRVTSVLVRIGDAVARGQPLLTLESPDADAARSAYLQGQASVTSAHANVTKAQLDVDRQRNLFEHEAAAMKDVQAAENAFVQAKTAAEQADAALEQAKSRLAVLGLSPNDFKHNVTVPAPISGKVLELSIAPGEYRNDLSASLMTIADLSTVWVAADVPESYIRFIRVGEPIETTLVAYPGEVFTGRVSRIADTVSPQTRTVKVQAEIANPNGRLRPEMFGSIHHVESTSLMPIVRSTAVIQGNGKNIVFVQVGPGEFKQVEITVGKPMGDVLPVTSGVKANDNVVVDGAMLLKGMVRSST